MAEDPSFDDPVRPATRPRPSNWAHSSGVETIVPWVVTVDLQRYEDEEEPRAPEQPRVTTPADEDWMTGCYYF